MIDLVGGAAVATIGGKHQDELTFSPVVAQQDLCSGPISIDVPLKGKNLNRKASAVIKMQSITMAPAGENRGVKDTDKLKLTCLPPTP